MTDSQLSKQWSDSLAVELGGILNCTYSAEDLIPQTDEGITYHKARISIIPSNEKPTLIGTIAMAHRLKKKMAVQQSIALGQNEDLAALINQHLTNELKDNPQLTISELKTKTGGLLYELQTDSGNIVQLRVTSNIANSDSGSVAIKIDYDGEERLPAEIQVAINTLRTALVAACEKTAPEFIKAREDHKRILGDSPPPPPSSPPRP